MRMFKCLLCLIVIFAAGAVSGGLIMRHLSGFPPGFGPPRPGDPGPAARWMQELDRRLELTPDQKAQLGPMLKEASDQLIQKVGTDILAGFDSANTRIMPVLTPTQREKYQQLAKEQTEMIKRLQQGQPPKPSP